MDAETLISFLRMWLEFLSFTLVEVYQSYVMRLPILFDCIIASKSFEVFLDSKKCTDFIFRGR